jgi:polyhydroxybutyrate depolymerase
MIFIGKAQRGRRGLIAHTLGVLLIAACGLAFVAPPAFAQDTAASAPGKKPETKEKAAKKPAAKKPAPSKKAAKKPATKKKATPAKPKAAPKPKVAGKPQAPRALAPAGPKFSTDTESAISRPGDHAFALQHGGLTRTYVIHVPPSYNMASPAPLVVLLHGGVGDADLAGDEPAYGIKAKSDSEGFIAVFPNGSGKPATWNAGDCCGVARAQKVDDVGFIRQVVGNVFRQMSIDRGRIFIAGISDGGMMAYRMACEVPALWKAVAVVAATDRTGDCSPATPVSVLHIHAKDDAQVPFAGAARPDAADKPSAPRAMSVTDTASKWAQLDGCAAQPRHILDKDGAYCEAYGYCRAQAEVQLCVTATGGHSWPGGKTRGASQALSATDLVWEFFSRR